MREGGEAAIGQQDVAFLQFRVHAGRMAQVVGAQRRGHHAQQQTGARMK